jgi:hypothetical protein
MIRKGTITVNDGLAYATNRQNLILQLSDFGGGSANDAMGLDTGSSDFIS